MKKRCDNPYGDIASVVALARANEKVPVLHLCLCECGAFFKSKKKTKKFCPSCTVERQKERYQKWLKKSKDKKKEEDGVGGG